MITRPDKGNSVVIMDKTDYDAEILKILSDRSKFKPRDRLHGRNNDKDLTIFREEQLKRYLYNLNKNRLISDDVYKLVSPSGSVPSRIYGTPKMHKVKGEVKTPPLRPIVSSIGAYNYSLSKYLSGLISPLLPTEHCAKDSFSFVDELSNLQLQEGNNIVSFDIVSLFTNIPLIESIDLAVNLLFEKDPSIKMSKAQMKKLFHFATAQTHFTYNNQYYDQVDGVAMGSPLGPVLANLFMGNFEEKWLKKHHGADYSPIFYKRYVDDIFCVMSSKEHVPKCLEELNKGHTNIQFTVEEENNGVLPFLDILIKRTEDMKFSTTTYRKPTNTGLLTNFTSFTNYIYKIGLVRTLVDRAFKINNSEELLDRDLGKISETLQKNMFPRRVVENIINKKKLDNFQVQTDESGKQQIRYFKFPFIGVFSKLAKNKIHSLIKSFCLPETNARLIFTTCKVGQYFSQKDAIPLELRSWVVYKFVCASCNASYIGQTTRHLSTRVNEHLRADKNSHV